MTKKLMNLFKVPKVKGMKRPEGAGNFDNMDDFNIVKAIDIVEGQIQNTPTSDLHITNKKYVDDSFPVTHASTTGQTATDHHDNSNDHASGSDDQVSSDFTHDDLIAGTIADHDTSATGAELDTLTDNSMADTLHRHSELSAGDGTPDRALVVDAIGNVGIGTAGPGGTLDVAGEIRITADDVFATNVAQIYTDATSGLIITGHAGTENDLLFTDSGGTTLLRNPQGTTDLLLIPSAGNVGIGTTSPKSKLHVTGLPVYADNAAAITGGLTAGAFYRTGTDPDPVMVVH